MATSVKQDLPFVLLKERDFGLLLTGQFVSNLGDKIHYVALGIWVFRLTGNPLAVGAMAISTLLPYLLFGLLAGVYVDRWEKKRTMIVCDVIRAGLVALLPFVISISLDLVYVVAFLLTTVSLLFSPAKMAVIPALFQREKILPATSLAESVENVTEILGYALAGVVTVLLSLDKVFYLDSLTFLVSALTISAMSFRFEAPAKPVETRVFTEIGQGLSFIASSKPLWHVLAVYCLALLVFSGFNPLIFVYALKALGTSNFGLGMLEMMHAVGITLGGLALSFIGPKLSKGRLMIAGYLLAGVTIALLGVFPWYPLAAAGFLFTGLSNALFLIPVQAIFQELTPADLRGRVFAARFTLTRISFMLSVGLLTFGASRTSVQAVYMVSGLVLAAISLLAFRLKSFKTI